MWKFKASKYKNAAPKIPKKEEWITDVSCNNLGSSCGNHIKASSAFIVFSLENAGGSNVGIAPLDFRGRHSSLQMKTIQVHSDLVTDFDFCPFDDFLLATCSLDCSLKLWNLPDNCDQDNLCNQACTLTTEEKRIESVSWNPVAENVIGASVGQSVKIFDVSHSCSTIDLSDHKDVVQSFSWKGDGTLLATSSRDKIVRILDPRSKKTEQTANGHQNNKDSRVLWLGEKDQIITTGFSQARQREIALRDVRNPSQPVKTLSIDSSTGIIMPFYDADTGMLFFGGKGDTTIRYMELTEKDPYLAENSVENVEQIKGLAVIPKRALNVMTGEVNRLLLLSQQSIIPLPYIVPRKSYREFQDDLFPDTFSGIPAVDSQQWFAGEDKQKTTVSLNPAKKSSLVLRRGVGSSGSKAEASNVKIVVQDTFKKTQDEETIIPLAESSSSAEVSVCSSEKSIGDSAKIDCQEKKKVDVVKPRETAATVAPPKEKKPGNIFSGVRSSKFRHTEGSVMHASLHIENLRNLSQTIPGESDAFQANQTYCAVGLGGPGGLIAVLKIKQPGRLPDTGIPALQNGSLIADFVWDPFDDSRLAVACDDAKIRIWNIPEGGLVETLTEPDFCLRGHTEKLYSIRFHPLARDVLASTSYDMTVRIWNLDTQEQVIQLNGHSDTIFSFSWSIAGDRCATTSKDGKLRIYDPRKSSDPILEGAGLEGSRGGRVTWTCNDKLVIATGFDRMSVRQIAAFDSENLSSCLKRIDIDTSPSILIPFYDEDSSTLFVTGRGDGIVRMFEISEDFPHIFPLSDFKAGGLHQAFSFLPKIVVDARTVEFARAFRLTANSVEPVSFKVPRVKLEYFQDDLFPDTKVMWEAVMNASEWFDGRNATQTRISLKPHDMKSLSEAPVEAPKIQKYENFQTYQQHYKTDEQKKEELLSAMTNKLCLDNAPLPQDLTEGVDPEEWDD